MDYIELLTKNITDWNSIEGVKPLNDKSFIDTFLICLKDADYEDFCFDGDGSYFGKQITWSVGSGNWIKLDRNLNFEIAYSESEIRVYSANNNGYWVSEYISVTKGDAFFEDVYSTLRDKLLDIFGLK